ncbi:MAG: methyltransferase domain-containing protein [Rubrobacter sp.]|nr:methyltransferase domain-containing protein [Rubrobacter sp.]
MNETVKRVANERWEDPTSARSYAARSDAVGGEARRRWTEVISEQAGEPPKRVLDVGTGAGLLALLYAGLGHEVTGLDFSGAMLSEARARSGRHGLLAEFVLGDAEALPFESGSFDVVTNRIVIWALPEPGVAVREWARVLAPGGRLVLFGNHPDSPSPLPRALNPAREQAAVPALRQTPSSGLRRGLPEDVGPDGERATVPPRPTAEDKGPLRRRGARGDGGNSYRRPHKRQARLPPPGAHRALARSLRHKARAAGWRHNGREEKRMTAESKTRPERRLCSVVSKESGDDPIGSATPFDGCLTLEVRPPWKSDIAASPEFPEGLWEQVMRAWEAGVIGKFTGILPDPEYSVEGYTRAILLRRPKDAAAFARYEKTDYLLPDEELIPFAGTLAEGPEALEEFGRYRQDTSGVRDILTCTHGQNDVCCGKFGTLIYKELRERYARESGGALRVWRASHIGGHRFAPTLIDYPEGRSWGHLEMEHVENLVLRNGEVSELYRFYRGWTGLGSKFEQIAEREAFAREGWAWTGYLKSAEVLEESAPGARVRLDYHSPDGSVSGAYEIWIEADGSVMTLGKSGDGPLQEVPQYRGSRIDRLP